MDWYPDLRQISHPKHMEDNFYPETTVTVGHEGPQPTLVILDFVGKTETCKIRQGNIISKLTLTPSRIFKTNKSVEIKAFGFWIL